MPNEIFTCNSTVGVSDKESNFWVAMDLRFWSCCFHMHLLALEFYCQENVFDDEDSCGSCLWAAELQPPTRFCDLFFFRILYNVNIFIP